MWKVILRVAVVLLVLPTISNGQGAVSIDQVSTLTSNYSIRPGEPARFVMRFDNTNSSSVNVSNGFKISSPDGAVWDSVTIDSAGPMSGGTNQFASYFDIVFALWGGAIKGGDGIDPDTVGMLGAGNPSHLNQGMPSNYNDTAIAVTVWMHETASFGKHICIDSAFWGAGGTWVWVGGDLVEHYPTFSGLPGQSYVNGSGTDRAGSGFCFELGAETPADTGYIRLRRWAVSEGGNDHWYAVVPRALPWKTHRGLAPSMMYKGRPAYLATLGSAEENSFVTEHVINGLHTDAIADEFYLGAHREGGVFGWITGEPWSYTHWYSGEPSGDGAAVTIWGAPSYMTGYWNDVPDDTIGVGTIHQLWALIEWDSTGGGPLSDTLRVPEDYATIQAAIEAAEDGNIVLVSPGNYAGGINFLGKSLVVRSTDGPLATTILGPATATAATIPPAIVTFSSGESSTSLLEGFTLQGGWIGVLCLGSGPTIRHNILRGQQVDNWAAISLAGSFPGHSAIEGPAPAIIENNTIVNCQNGGISTFSTVAPVIKNNIIAFNGHYGIHRQSLSMPLVISYNDIYGNLEATQNVPDEGPGALHVDPLFAASNALTENSPCINAGDPDSMYNDPDGSRNDMGAIPYGGSGPAGLMNLVQWRVADGGNDHWYAVIPEKLYWIDADAAARTFSQGGFAGHLATVRSPQENQFIVDHVLVGANQQNQFDNFFIGGRDINGGWRWITGESWGYTNWASGEPNNNGVETALCMYGHYDTYSHAIPGTWNNSLPDSSVNHLHQYWSVVEFGPLDTIVEDEPIPTNEWISLYCSAPLLDGQPLAPGTVLRAFDPQGVLCGKAAVKQDGSIGFMLVYRDDPYTAADEGAVPGDKISFRVGAEVVTVAPSVYWTQNGDQFQACSFERKACITLHLQQGWNLVSWNVGWTGAPRELLAPVINCVEFVLGFDHGGLVYDPQLERYSTLNQVDYLHGYWVKMACAADLEVCGDQLPSFTAIPVSRGWNLVGYSPLSSMAPMSGFITINANLQVAIGYDGGAKVYMPNNPSFNTLTSLDPGFGYWLRMSNDDYLEYGFMPVDEGDLHPAVVQGSANGEYLGSRIWMSLFGDNITLDGSPIANNSTIEVWTQHGELVGHGQYMGDVLKFMPIYGNDGDAESAGMPSLNDQLTLKVNGREVAERITWSGEGTSYRISSLTTSSLPTTFALEQNYPNPFNPATTVAFTVPNFRHVRLVVYNLLGQEIRTLADQEYEAGRYEVVWDGRDRNGDAVPTGLYFYRMETSEFSKTRKMMLLK